MNQNEKYQEVEEEFFNGVSREFGEALLFYCVTGSLVRKEIIPGWSDIDILMVFEKYEDSMFSKLNDLVEESKKKNSVKIGITFYSLQEFNSMLFQDPKTYISIYYMNSGIVTPRIHSEKVSIKNVTRDLIKTVSLAELTKQLHAMKRDLMNYSQDSEKKIYKCMLTIMKIILIFKEEIPLGYADAFTKIKKHFNDDFQKIILPEDIINKPDEFENRKHYYIEFLNWLNDKNNALLS